MPSEGRYGEATEAGLSRGRCSGRMPPFAANITCLLQHQLTSSATLSHTISMSSWTMSLRALRELPNGMLGSFRNGRTVAPGQHNHGLCVAVYRSLPESNWRNTALALVFYSHQLVQGIHMASLSRSILRYAVKSRVRLCDDVWRSAG